MLGQPDGRRRRSALVAGVVALVLIAVPLGAAPSQEPRESSAPLCVEPHPCEYVWEGADLGLFALADVEEVEVESHDGVMLHGWLAFPDLPGGMRAPVALHSSPYLGWCPNGSCTPHPGDPEFWADDPGAAVVRTWGVPPIELVRRGYIAAFFEVRGTGESGGCFDLGGAKETQDQAVLVDWLAAQPWSNGRVGMGGNSYAGTTPWQAAIKAPDGLKTIVTAGIVSDQYTFVHTPQGAWKDTNALWDILWEPFVTWLPHPGGGSDPLRDAHAVAGRVAALCEPVAYTSEGAAGSFLRDRDPGYWEPLRYINRFNQVRASVLMPHGLQDVTGHAFQDMLVWEALQGPGVRPRPPRLPCPGNAPACAPPLSPPMWQISGQWGHGPPFAETPALTPQWVRDNWDSILFGWLGYWLQGVGTPPTHRVDYQDTTGAWHTSSAWPPAEAREEALYLDGDRITTKPGEQDRRLRAAASPGQNHSWSPLLGVPVPPAVFSWCRQNILPGQVPDTAVAYVSEPFAADSLLAGNPFAYLELSSDQEGGVVDVALLRWPAGASCADGPDVLDLVAHGTADLRYHDGGYEAQPFDTEAPTAVRVDLHNNAVRFAPGDRLVAVMAGSEVVSDYASTSPYTPELTVHAGLSHVVVPFVSGGLGGDPSGIDYPPNPAAPPWTSG